MSGTVEQLIENFFSKYQTKHYSKGQVLILKGEGGDVVFNLVSGRVKQYGITYRGDEIILNVYKPPAFFPMSLVINQTENQYIYEAETDIQLQKVPAQDVIAFLKSNPDVTFDLLSRVYRGVDGIIGRMAQLMSASAKERVMYELKIACERYGEKTEEGSVTLEMKESELGARAGLSRETVSREMKKLIRAGLISFNSGKIVVKDPSAFEVALAKAI